ncbi:MAG TPA: BMP family ABC transporter substrate-binding protein [Streptosporangiaceae bacterium]
MNTRFRNTGDGNRFLINPGDSGVFFYALTGQGGVSRPVMIGGNSAAPRGGTVRGTVKAVTAISVLALLAAGCGNSKPSSPSGGSSSSSPAAGPSFTACMVTDTGGLDDKSFNQSSWEGFQAAAKTDPSIQIKNLPSTSPADYAKNISTFEGENCGIIITVGFLMASATQTAAAADPKQKFAIVDCSYASFCLPLKKGAKPLTNIDQLVYNTVQDGFLGGYLAAGMTKTGKVATYGGMQFGTVTIYEDGFWDGVQYYNSKHGTHVQVLGWSEKTQKGTMAGSFTNLGAGQQIANTFINEGADIIFPVAGGVGLGTAKAVQTADASGKNISMMWVDTDGCISAAAYCKYFITSVEKGITSSVKAAILSAANGTFKGGTYVGTLSNGGAVLAPFHDWASKVPTSLKNELNALTKQIESGQIVPATKSPV